MNKPLKIISRNSKLAMWQANFVSQQLTSLYPDLKIEIIGITTKGDKILDKALDKIGGKGLFIKELEHAIQNNTADLAIHSLKDLPAVLPHGFSLAAVLEREDPSDAFVSNQFKHISKLPNGAIIGTSSARRSAILKYYYPHLNIALLRGNVETRIAKLDAGEYDGIILASSGLIRLGLSTRIAHKLDLGEFVPAIGQGSLAIEVLSVRTDLIKLLKPLNNQEASFLAGVERLVGNGVDANCSTPIGVYARLLDNNLELNGMYYDVLENAYRSVSLSYPRDEHQDAIRVCIAKLTCSG